MSKFLLVTYSSINKRCKLYREDFLVLWHNDGQDSDEYAFYLLSCMAKKWMEKSDLSRGEWTEEMSPTVVYQRLLWSKLLNLKLNAHMCINMVVSHAVHKLNTTRWVYW